MDRRFFAAMFMSMLVIIAYSSYNLKLRKDYIEKHPEYAEQLRQQSMAGKEDIPSSTAERPDIAITPQEPATMQAPPSPSASTDIVATATKTDEMITVSSPLYQIQIAAQGGRPVSWKLLHFQESTNNIDLLKNYQKKLANEGSSPDLLRIQRFLDRKVEWAEEMEKRLALVNPEPKEDETWPAEFAVEIVPTLWNTTPPLNLNWNNMPLDDFVAYDSNQAQLDVFVDDATLELRGKNGPFEIVKTFVFRPDDYAFDYSIAIKNISSSTLSFASDPTQDEGLSLTWDDGLGLDLFNDSWTPPVYFQISNSIKKEGSVAKDQNNDNIYSLDWAAIQNKYFGAFIVPHGQVFPRAEKKRSQYDHGSLDLVIDVRQLAPGEQATETFEIYVGPKDPPHLKQFGHDTSGILFIGFFRRMAKPFGLLFWWLLHSIQTFVGNWGLAIIVLTILTKVAMYPLMRKQMQSMKNMQRIQPMLKELQEKHKDNQAKYQKEMMALYKREKVNPAGGCLPLLLTMPIFIALYIVIYIAPELRGAPFMLWIQDLSQPDSLFSFYLPGLNWVVRFNVLPLVNGVYQYYSTKQQVVDPKQAGMMQMMPLIFVFIFWNFPSGLVLYWILQAVLGTLQQKIFNHLHEKDNARRNGESGKKTSPARSAKRAKK